MSRRSGTWRQQARQAAYDYPALKAELRDLRSMSTSPALTGLPSGGEGRRSTEDAALRELPPEQQRRHDAVERALSISEHLTSGLNRVQLIELVYFRRSHTVEGAALRIPCSPQTAQLWNSDFLLLVWSALNG